MTKLVTVVLAFFLFTSFNPPKENFEGIITYKITFTPKPGNEEYTKHQSQKYGTTLKLTHFKNGNFKREYPSSGLIFGVDFNIYMQTLNRLYTKLRNNDTIKASDCSKNTLIQKEESEKPGETVHGVICKSYYISGGDAKSRQPLALQYFYPTDKNLLIGNSTPILMIFFIIKWFLKMQAPFYKLIMELTKYTITFELEKIETKKLTEDLIQFPKGKPVKEL